MQVSDKQADWIGFLVMFLTLLIRSFLLYKRAKPLIRAEMARIEAEMAEKPRMTGWRYQTLIERFTERLARINNGR